MLLEKFHHIPSTPQIKKLHNLFFTFLFAILMLSGVFVKTAFSAAPVAENALLGFSDYAWAKTYGNGNAENGAAVDSRGNVYVISHSGSVFLKKYTNDGALVWSKTFSGTGISRGYNVYIDSSDNIFLTGAFSGTFDFDPSGSVDSHASAGGHDVFVVKLNSDGTYGWAKTFGSTGADVGGVPADRGKSITVDNLGNIYITGSFLYTADLDPGAGTANFVSNGNYDAFLLKLDSQGDYLWAMSFGGIDYDFGYGVTHDSANNIYMSGRFSDTVDFDPTAGEDILTDTYDKTFFTKINSDGTYAWTKKMPGIGMDYRNDIIVDSNDNLFIAGTYNSFTGGDFDPGPGTDYHASKGNVDAYLTKFNADGTYGWTKAIGGPSNDGAEVVTVDRFGNIYLSGRFAQTVDFDSSAGVDIKIASSNVFDFDVFMTKINADGTYGWTKTFGTDAGYDAGYGLAIDYSGNIFSTGKVGGSTDLDPSSGIAISTGGGTFIVKVFPEDEDFIVTPNGSVAATLGAYDIDGDSLTYSILSGPSYGNITGFNSSTGAFTYTPNTDYKGADSFTFKVVDSGALSSNIATVSLSVGTAPVASAGSLVIAKNSSGGGQLNATDADGGSFIYELAYDALYGSVVINASGGYTYTSDENWFGSDNFLFKVTDSSGISSNVAQVDITVVDVINNAPVTVDGSLSLDENTVAFGSLVSYSSDIDADSFSYVLVSSPVLGTLTSFNTTTGFYMYNPPADYSGSDSFTFKVMDSYSAYSNISTVGINVISTNIAPVAIWLGDEPVTVIEDGTLNGTVNATDIDEDTFTYLIVSTTSYGSLELVSSTGYFSYFPDDNYNGVDSFSYKANDGLLDSNVETVSIVVSPVNDEPVPSASNLACVKNIVCNVQVYPNDVDLSDSHSYSVTTLASSGTAVVDGSGYVTYTPSTDFAGVDYFVVTVTDSGGLSGNVSINVSVANVEFPDGDTGTLGVERGDNGSDGDNLDDFTGNPVVDMEYVFSIIFQDTTGNAPQSAMLYLTNRTNPNLSDYFTYDLTCVGDYATGAECSYTIVLPPSAVNNFHFEIVRSDGTLYRYPSAGNATGPQVEMLNNYAMLSVPKDIDSENLDSTEGFECSTVYRWVSQGTTVRGVVRGSYELVSATHPLRAGEAYFVKKETCAKGTVPELPIYSNLAADSHEIVIEPGWNIISNPYGGKVRLSDMKVQKGSDAPIAWDAAVGDPNNWLTSGTYYSDGQDWGSTYTVQSTPDAELVPWLGYWVYLTKDDDTYKLIFTKP